MSVTSTTDLNVRLHEFRRLYNGLVITTEDESYPGARMGWNRAADQRPAGIAQPLNAVQVSELVTAAAASGLRVAPQGTGHNAGSLESLHDTILMKTHLMREIQVDPMGRTATVAAGVLWEDVIAAVAPYGLTALHGSSPNVGVAGYLLGGGISWYARSHGIASNTIVGVDIVLADGSHVRADAEHHTDVFWAVRGGGANFGVVTAVEFQLIEIESVYAGMMIWDQDHAATVLQTWREWSGTAPDTITTAFRLMNFPSQPDIPDFLRGRRLVVIDGAALTDAVDGAEILAALRALAPELNTFSMVLPQTLLDLHMDPVGPLPVVSESAVLSSLDDAAMDDLLRTTGPAAPPHLLFTELRHLGGALARSEPRGGAISQLAGEFLLFTGTVAPTPEAAEQATARASAVVGEVARHGSELPCLNFVDRPTDVQSAFESQTWQQLVEIKSAVDPTGLFVAAHPIPTPRQPGMTA